RAVLEVAAYSASVMELCGNIDRTGRSYYAQFPAPIDLYALVRLVRPRTIVESGVASGVSSAFMLMGAKTNSRGTLHSIDLPVLRTGRPGDESWAVPAGMSSGWATPSSLRVGWDLREGRSEELLVPLLEELGTVDFFCHDSPVDREHFEFEMQAVEPHLGPGSLVVADNTYRRAFGEAARRVGAEAVYRKGSSLGAFRVPADGA
ncbi:MAG: class I SAM-dependent methyltransferase, partial [Nitrososphaerota archaeon]|nr:class I SAM-dependent methyltransferase [Nitrososphaerota archaeon]